MTRQVAMTLRYMYGYMSAQSENLAHFSRTRIRTLPEKAEELW